MNVTIISPEALEWPFDGEPGYRLKSAGWTRLEKVDPTPGYAPDPVLVRELVAECCARFPLRAASEELYVLPREFLNRTNGWCSREHVWHRPDGSDWVEKVVSPIDGKERERRGGLGVLIVLSGKRIPVHPAMIRYLVAHEYGHAAFYAAIDRLGYLDSEIRQAEEAYLKLRGPAPETPPYYGGGTWHVSASEIIANDFRFLVMGKETEFWPHPVPAPTWDSPVAEWWRKVAALGGPSTEFAQAA